MSGISGSFGYCCMARNSPLTRRQQIVPSPIVLLLPPHFSLPVFLVTCRCDPFRFLYLLKHFRARGRIYARPNARARRRARARAQARARLAGAGRDRGGRGGAGRHPRIDGPGKPLALPAPIPRRCDAAAGARLSGWRRDGE